MSLLNGLSTMGAAISQQAGAMGLAEQKRQSEIEMTQLANSLASARESQGRAESAKYASDARGEEQDFQASQQSERIKAQSDLTDKEIKARSSNLAQQIAAGAVEQSFDADGNAITINKLTRKAEPIIGIDGKPVKVGNQGQAKAISEMIMSTRDDLRSTIVQRNTDVRAAQASLTEAQKSGTPEDIAAAKAEMADVKAQYDPHISELQSRMQNITESLMTKSKLPTSAVTGTPDMPTDSGMGITGLGSQAGGLINSLPANVNKSQPTNSGWSITRVK